MFAIPNRARHPRYAFATFWHPPQCSASSTTSASAQELDAEIRSSVLAVCGQSATSIRETTAASGQTSRHFRAVLSDGTALLVKAARPQTSPSFARARFHAEQVSLRALRSHAADLWVPRGLGTGGSRTPLAFIEWADLAPFGLWVPGTQAALGRALATLHTQSESRGGTARVPVPGFGFETTTYLGEAVLDNKWCIDWVAFFIAQRLVPRLQEALLRGAAFYGTSNEAANAISGCMERVCDVDRVRRALFGGVEVLPALLHGDLFSGNCGVSKGKRECVVFDPASYWGHAEVDLAVSTLFGRFGEEFYDAYHEVRPKEKGFEERKVLYRFYYLLNLLVRYGAGFGPGGSTQDPKGYFEMCCEHANALNKLLE